MKTGNKNEKVAKEPQKRTNCISLEQLEEEIKEPTKLIMALLDYGIVKKPFAGAEQQGEGRELPGKPDCSGSGLSFICTRRCGEETRELQGEMPFILCCCCWGITVSRVSSDWL